MEFCDEGNTTSALGGAVFETRPSFLEFDTGGGAYHQNIYFVFFQYDFIFCDF